MNAYQKITEKIVEQLNAGVIPWHRPWANIVNTPVKHTDGKEYSLLNQMLLGFVPGEYITYNQAGKEGGHVRKGAKARTVYFWGEATEDVVKEDGTVEKKTYRFPKIYQVFNMADVEGVQPKWADREPEKCDEHEMTSETILDSYMDSHPEFSISYGKTPLYERSSDTAQIPDISLFKNKESYYKVLFHLIARSTGVEGRLGRSTAQNAKEDQREELLAEICSAMVCSAAGLDTDKTVEDTASYIAKWVPALKSDPQMIVWASSRAEAAAKYILGQES